MKKSSLIEKRRRKVNPEIRRMVDLSFKIVDRIHDILQDKDMKQEEICTLYQHLRKENIASINALLKTWEKDTTFLKKQ